MILSRGKLFAAIVVFSLVTQPALLWATPNLQEKRSQAEQLAKEINSIDDRSEVAVEQYNQAQLKLNNIQSRLVETRTKLAKAQVQLQANQGLLNHRVAGIYKSGETMGLLNIVLSAKSLGDFIGAVESLQRVSKQDAKVLTRIKKYRFAVERDNQAIAGEEKSQAATTADLKSRKNEVQARLRDRQGALKKVKEEIATAESEQARASLARVVVRPRSLPIPTVNVSGSGSGAAAARLAMAELGKPYVWAAAGPNSFDCSGLTMYVYGKLGISLPHSAQAQYNMGTHVSRDQLQPGDLIFGGSGGYISHVGIYIGGDAYVNAPQTGDVVKISSLSARRNYVGATRL